MNLRLPKLPDRTPVKLSVTVSPELNKALLDYAEIYRRLYGGQKESVTDLIPYMLDAFIQNDRAFAKARRELDGPPAGASSGKRG
jgi:hypothetical protein